MATFKLITAGNTNIYTWVNSVIAATKELQKNEDEETNTLVFENIHIFHTDDSIKKLYDNNTFNKWKTELAKYGIEEHHLIHHTYKIEENNNEIATSLISQLRNIIAATEQSQYYIDLTNGVSSIKSMFAILAYVMNIQHVYLLEINFQGNPTLRECFYDQLKEAQLDIHYKKLPNTQQFDDFGRLNMSDIIRYESVIGKYKTELTALLSDESTQNNIELISSYLLNTMNLRLKNLNKVDTNKHDLRSEIMSFATTIELFTDSVLDFFNQQNANHKEKPLGQKFEDLQAIANNHHKYFISMDILKHFTTLINNIRNEIIHHKSDISVENLKVIAELKYALLSAYLGFTINSIKNFVRDDNMVNVQEFPLEQLKNEEFYFGFDGDDTGNFIEQSLDANDEEKAKANSINIAKVLKALTQKIQKESQNKDSLIFYNGDNIMFKGTFDIEFIKELQQYYTTETGLFCSIGFGKTLADASLALKLAKAKSKKENTIFGLHIIPPAKS